MNRNEAVIIYVPVALKKDGTVHDVMENLAVNETKAVEIVGTEHGKMFKLAASDADLDTLDPFVAILNNLDSLNFKAEDGKLVVTSEDFSFAVELNGNLPAKIAVVHQNSTIAIASYINISINDAEVNDSIIYDFLQPENESRLRGVYYFFSPHCPHCSEVKPIVEMCNVTYCNVSNMSADCMEVCRDTASCSSLPSFPSTSSTQRFL